LTAESIFYGVLVRQAIDRRRLLADNRRLRREVARVEQIEGELKQLQQFGKRVQRSLTEGTDLERIMEASEAIQVTSQPKPIAMDESWASGGIYDMSEPMSPAFGLFNDAPVKPTYRYPILWPVEGFITRGFEVSPIDPLRGHAGLDIAVPRGTPVRAIADGVVLVADWTPRLGHRIIIDHGGGIISIYGHNEMPLVYQRERVKAGIPLALSGNSGISTAPHLHLEIWVNGQVVDPLSLLPQRGDMNEEKEK